GTVAIMLHGKLLLGNRALVDKRYPLVDKRLPLSLVAILFLGKQARPLLGLRLCLGGDDLELLELGHGPVALGLEGDLRLAHALRLAQQLTGLLELGRQAVTFRDDTAQLGRRALQRLAEGRLEPLDLCA